MILWLLLSIALRFDRAPRTAVAPGEPSPPDPTSRPGPAPLDPSLVAAISVAVIRHTEALRRQAAPAMRSHAPGSLLFASHWVASGRTRQGQPWRRRAR